MRIGLVAPPWTTVPPATYGGTEAVVDALARGLAADGHDVRLFTLAGSTCPVSRDWLFDEPADPVWSTTAEAAHVLAAYDALHDCDVVHDHTTLGALLGPPRTRAAVVATVHNPLTPLARRVYAAATGRAALVAISRAQAASAPEVPFTAVVHHGVDVDAYQPAEPGEQLVFVGRMCADKGVHRAIAVARATQRRLVVITKMREPDEVAYFEREVEPLLGGDIDLRGEVAPAERNVVIASSAALLNPIRWAEPFGLVMIEALAAGTPVIAFAEGAAPEIVRHGHNGFLCADEAEMVAAVCRVGDLDRDACRADARARFSAERMVADHERLYQGLRHGRIRLPHLPLPRAGGHHLRSGR